MGWAEERARLLSDDAPVIEAVAEDVVPYPLPVKWGHQRGDIAVQDPWGDWHEISFRDATPVWKAALRRNE